MKPNFLLIIILLASISSCEKEEDLSSFEMLTDHTWYLSSLDYEKFDKLTGELLNQHFDTIGEFVPYKLKLNTDYSTQFWLRENWSFTEIGTWQFDENENIIDIDLLSYEFNIDIESGDIISLTDEELIIVDYKSANVTRHSSYGEEIIERILKITYTFINEY